MRKVIFLLMTTLVLTSDFAFSQNSIKRPDTYNYNRGVEELRNENYDDALIYFNKEIDKDFIINNYNRYDVRIECIDYKNGYIITISSIYLFIIDYICFHKTKENK